MALTTKPEYDPGAQMSLLGRTRMVLVGTTHPGNIGAAARAMKAMGLRRLVLVDPKSFPAAEATAMASGADDLLAAAEVVETLAEGLSGCGLVVGTTARPRHLEWPVHEPQEAMAKAAALPAGHDLAIVFGPEHSGLSNAELDRCQMVIRIPTDPRFSSLNIAQAVQICAYEVRLAAQRRDGSALAPNPAEPPATAAELEGLYQHTMAVMTNVGYFDPAKPKLLPRRIRRLWNRIRLERSEAQILRGFLAAIERRLKDPKR